MTERNAVSGHWIGEHLQAPAQRCFLVTLNMEQLRSSETSAHATCTQLHLSGYDILHSQCCDNLNLTKFHLYRNCQMPPNRKG
jgi:hypothetical protein